VRADRGKRYSRGIACGREHQLLFVFEIHRYLLCARPVVYNTCFTLAVCDVTWYCSIRLCNNSVNKVGKYDTTPQLLICFAR
jgi:hypothetical protein